MNFGEEFRKYAVHHMGMSGLGIDDYIKHNVQNMTPNIIEERPMRFAAIDVFSRLIMDRIIFLGTGVDDYVANVVVAQLLFLESVDAKKDVLMYINSPGGSVYAGLGMYDTMQYVRPDVATICTSLAASMGAVLLAGGAAGKRSALPHARVMIHQPSGGAQGQSRDMEITVKEIIKLRRELYEILANHTGKTLEQIEQDSDRDYWMKAEEAKTYGLIDEVLYREK
ncbi:ATP-dependent Clp protease proteolytic subunit [Emticicia oligotrophica DSM 17448]|uniref:ATP-dependent Clp protease proteolytic subunit n=1 Tax=Emticicia oligotrophica (strain DSM 17448 / CIP 109782 / MTCC 6937 / GPTSA100-15) TaxID=929562 RepID=A0ABM5N3N1_EMTOG|nr:MULTISPECIES: ATP-dependent Clp protease proteolytic subunit [Emticicia]AFK04087.1 ATP-dependent Clp protease proteolytic subunit [Emticicia oligotrophica DSM 17448]